MRKQTTHTHAHANTQARKRTQQTHAHTRAPDANAQARQRKGPPNMRIQNLTAQHVSVTNGNKSSWCNSASLLALTFALHNATGPRHQQFVSNGRATQASCTSLRTPSSNQLAVAVRCRAKRHTMCPRHAAPTCIRKVRSHGPIEQFEDTHDKILNVFDNGSNNWSDPRVGQSKR